MASNLSNDNLKKLNILITISNSIMQIYLQLSKLEYSENKNNPEYHNLVNTLKSFLEVEEKIYQKIDKKIEILDEMIYNLLIYNENNLTINLEHLKNNDYENIIKARIANRLDQIIIDNNLYYDDFEPEVDIDEFINEEDSFEDDEDNLYCKYGEYGEFDFDEAKDSEEEEEIVEDESTFNYKNFLQNAVMKDAINTIMWLLNEYINDEEYKNIKKYLVNFKYLIAFAYEHIEKYLINNNFEINKELYLSAEFFQDLNGEMFDLNFIKNEQALDLLDNHGEDLIELYYKEIDEWQYVKAIMNSIITRAGLIFADNEITQDYKNFILNEIFDYEGKNEISDRIIYKTLGNIEKDKEIPSIVRFKL